MEISATKGNPLGWEKIPKLLIRFGVPSIISMLVNALYNIVDQIFIGQGVGMLGNAATNVAFPLNTASTALALLVGMGAAANFNLAMGRGEPGKAIRFVGTGLTLLVAVGLAMGIGVRVFVQPLMVFFGATPNVLPYAVSYTGITALGLPFVMFTIGTSHLIRADGSPTASMICTLTGAVINTILDPIFIFVFRWGIAGAAWATVLGQIVSCMLALRYMVKFKTGKLSGDVLRPQWKITRRIMALGVASFSNHVAMMIVQIVLNNTLTYYGAQSVYGADIPLAVAGIISKVSIVFMALVVGIAQGSQPVFGFNYGARNYQRVRTTYKYAAIVCSGIAILFFLSIQLFSRQIVSIFGTGSPLYYTFAEKYFRTFMFFSFLNGIQPLTSQFFTAIGKALRGMFISMTRQIIFLLPLMLLLPLWLGIEGVLYAGPTADFAAAALAVLFVYTEMRNMKKLELAGQ